MARPGRIGTALLLAALSSACTAPVATGLDDAEANRIVLALERGGIAAQKEHEGGNGGRVRVTVADDDVGAALARLDGEGLLHGARPDRDGDGEGSALSGLVASRARAARDAASLLSRSLESIDGVVAARVHVGASDVEPFARDAPPATASVLLEHRGAEPPIAADAVQRLVAGGLPGLAPERVSVVLIARPAGAPLPADAAFARVGPIVVARGSRVTARVAFAVLLLLVATFATATLTLAARLVASRRSAARPGAAP